MTALLRNGNKKFRLVPNNVKTGSVDEKKAAATYEYKGKKYCFCAAGCKDKFSKDSEKFLGKEKK
jgi:YHS domain-containing protein